MDLYEKVRKTTQELRKALASGNIKTNTNRQQRLKQLIPELTEFCYKGFFFNKFFYYFF